MAYGTAVSQGSSGENISHFTGIRMRVLGSGQLDMTLYSLSEVESQELVPFTMANPNSREPFRLCNFNQQRCTLRIGTDAIDEQFTITRVIIFAKQIWTSFPGTE